MNVNISMVTGVMLLSMMKNLQLAEWNDMVAININGVMNGVAAVLPIMRAQKFGHIVNMSSDADRKVFPGSAIYSGTKAFVSMMSEGLRMELCQDGIPVHVTSLSAGAFVPIRGVAK
jgi:NADP-dependent 3-hydroxy acid dehydrogenase YdfG